MIPKQFRNPSSQSPDVNVLAQAVGDYTEQLASNPLLRGQLIKGVRVNTARLQPHNLGTSWTGFIITNRNSGAEVYAAADRTQDKLYLNLLSTADVIVDIWVF